MKIKGVFFDLYGTLVIYGNMVKAWEDWILAIHECLIKYGYDNSKELLTKKCDRLFEKPLIKEDGELTFYERRIQNLTNELGLNLKNEEITNVCLSGLYAWHKYVSIDPETIPLLKKIKKSQKIALITNFDHPPHIYRFLFDLDLKQYFDKIVISGEIGIKKPNPKIFSFALNDLGLNPKEVLFVGDSPEDIQGASAATIYPILIQRNKNKRLISDYNLEELYAQENPENELFKEVTKISKLSDLVNYL